MKNKTKINNETPNGVEKSKFTPEFTMYKNIKDPRNGINENSLERVIDYLSGMDDFVKGRTQYIQNFKNEQLTDEEIKSRKSSKEDLPVACFNGTFRYRAKDEFLKHSGMMILDYDGYESKEIMHEAFEKLKDDPSTVLLFGSSSGLGIKQVIRVSKRTTTETHQEIFQAFYEQTGKSKYFDHSGKDIARACFIPYDPNYYLNLDAIEFGNEIHMNNILNRSHQQPRQKQKTIIDSNSFIIRSSHININLKTK